jgi:hypothetical protein
MRYKHTKEELEEAVRKSLAIAGVCRELNIKAYGGNYKTLHAKFREWEIDTSHFTGAAWNQGEKFTPFGKTYKLVDVLIENSPYKSSTKLKERLFKEGLKTEKCEVCGISEWMGKKITLELDHINGDNTDNRLVNLCVLCPNCHSQTSTFRNKKRGNIIQKEIRIKTVKEVRIKTIKEVKQNLCECGKSIFFKSKTCVDCGHIKSRKTERPNIDELIKEVKETSYSAVGKKYGVSDNAIRKWIKNTDK